MRAIDRAIKIGRFAPANIICDDQVEFAVAIVIYPSGAGGKFTWAPHSRGLSYIRKCSVAVVVEEMTLPECSNKEIVEPVVIVIANRDSQPEHRHRQSGLPGNIGEGSIAIVVIELWSGWSSMRMSSEIACHLPAECRDSHRCRNQ